MNIQHFLLCHLEDVLHGFLLKLWGRMLSYVEFRKAHFDFFYFSCVICWNWRFIFLRLIQEFACNGTVIDHPEYGEVLQLQGDQRENICQFLTKTGLAKSDQLKVHGFWVFRCLNKKFLILYTLYVCFTRVSSNTNVLWKKNSSVFNRLIINYVPYADLFNIYGSFRVFNDHANS